MQEEIRNIESLYQSQLANLKNWRKQAIEAVQKEHSVSLVPILPPPIELFSLDWKDSEPRLQAVHQFFIKEKIIFKQREQQDYEIIFSPHFYKERFTTSAIKIRNIKKATWAFYILSRISVITNQYLHLVLPQHCLNKEGIPLSPDTLETYLTRIRNAKELPAFIRDMLLFFPSKSLPKDLLKK